MSAEADLGFELQLVGDATICYSGGLDSTTVAYLAARQGKGKVHLFTLDHGYGYLFNSWTGRTARSLARAVGQDRVVHFYFKTKELFDQLAMGSLVQDRREYGQWFGCCLGCTMAMFTNIIIYNLERCIPHVMMGSSVGGTYAVMSMPVTVALQKEFCARYGILYSPVLLEQDIRKDVERRLLDEAGVFRGLRFWDKHSFGNQGYCLLSVQHALDVVANVHPEYDPEQVQRFYRDRLPLCEAYIAAHFRRSGQDLDALVARVQALHQGGSEQATAAGEGAP